MAGAPFAPAAPGVKSESPSAQPASCTSKLVLAQETSVLYRTVTILVSGCAVAYVARAVDLAGRQRAVAVVVEARLDALPACGAVGSDGLEGHADQARQAVGAVGAIRAVAAVADVASAVDLSRC